MRATSTQWNADKSVLRRDHTLRRLESQGRSVLDTFSPTDDLLPLCPEETTISGAERRAESRWWKSIRSGGDTGTSPVARGATPRRSWCCEVCRPTWIALNWESTWVVAYLGGHGAMPPLWPDMKIFYRRLYMKRCVFAILQQELQNSTMFDGLLRFQISEKWANLRFPLNIQMQKVFQLQGASPPSPWPGALPLDPAGGSAPRPPL